MKIGPVPEVADLADVDALVRRARALAPGAGSAGSARGVRRILGIVGAPGAGKSTLVDELLARLRADPPAGHGDGGDGSPDWVAHLPMDGFHLADAQLDRLGLRHRKGAPDTFDADGYAALLGRVRDQPGRTVYAPGFERRLEQPVAAALAVPAEARLVLTEGNYLLLDDPAWTPVRDLLDEAWFVDVDAGLRRERLVERHVRFGKEPAAATAWVDEVDEPNAVLVEASAGRADLLLR